MDLDLDGKGVVITGGASNIGRALTLGFAAEGARVLIADVDDAQAEAVIDWREPGKGDPGLASLGPHHGEALRPPLVA